MGQIREAALRFNRIVDTLKNSDKPLTVYDLARIPDVREVSQYDNAVQATLNTLHKRGLVRKLPCTNPSTKAIYMWEYVDKVAVKPVVYADTPKAANDTTEQGTVVKSLMVGKPKYKQVATAVIKPEVTVESDRILINHPACNIVISLLT